MQSHHSFITLVNFWRIKMENSVKVNVIKTVPVLLGRVDDQVCLNFDLSKNNDLVKTKTLLLPAKVTDHYKELTMDMNNPWIALNNDGHINDRKLIACLSLNCEWQALHEALTVAECGLAQFMEIYFYVCNMYWAITPSKINGMAKAVKNHTLQQKISSEAKILLLGFGTKGIRYPFGSNKLWGFLNEIFGHEFPEIPQEKRWEWFNVFQTIFMNQDEIKVILKGENDNA